MILDLLLYNKTDRVLHSKAKTTASASRSVKKTFSHPYILQTWVALYCCEGHVAGFCNPTVGKEEANIDGNAGKEFSSFLVVHALTSTL